MFKRWLLRRVYNMAKTYEGNIELQKVIQESVNSQLTEQTMSGCLYEGFDCWAKGADLKRIPMSWFILHIKSNPDLFGEEYR